MNLLIFGASGGTGRELVRQALAQGHSVTSFVRDPAKFTIKHHNLKIAQGNVADATAIERAVRDQDGVLCALGSATIFGRNPALAEGVRRIIHSMRRAGVCRFIYLSAMAVREGRSQAGFLGRYIIAPLILRNVAADHEASEEIIKQSSLDWVIARPPRLTNGERTGAYRSGEHVEVRSIVPSISRADVADFMLKQLTDDTFLHKTPGMMY